MSTIDWMLKPKKSCKKALKNHLAKDNLTYCPQINMVSTILNAQPMLEVTLLKK